MDRLVLHFLPYIIVTIATQIEIGLCEVSRCQNILFSGRKVSVLSCDKGWEILFDFFHNFNFPYFSNTFKFYFILGGL